MPKRWLAVAALGLLLAGCASLGSNGKRIFESDTEFFWRKADPLLVMAVWQDAQHITGVRGTLPPVVTYDHMYLVSPDDLSEVLAYTTKDADRIIFYRAATDLCPLEYGAWCGPAFYEVMLHEYLHVIMLRQGIPFPRHHCLMLQKGYVVKMGEAIRARFADPSYHSPHTYRWQERIKKKCAS